MKETDLRRHRRSRRPPQGLQRLHQRQETRFARALNEVARFGPGLTKPPPTRRSVDPPQRRPATMSGEPAPSIRRSTCSPTRCARSGRARTSSLFSPGIADIREERLRQRDDRQPQPLSSIRRWSRSTRRTSSVYGVPACSAAAGSTPLYHQRLERITSTRRAAATSATRPLNPALEQIEKANNGYYLVTYRSQQRKRDGLPERRRLGAQQRVQGQARAGYLNE